jgi:phosphatidylglycerophosphatase A
MRRASQSRSRRPALTTSNNNPDARFLLAKPAHILALGFGAGLAPRAPGTVGTLLGFLLFWPLMIHPVTVQLAVLAVLFAVGIWACERTGRDLGVSDHGSIVWDEIVAFALVLAFTPRTPVWFAVAFLLFRLFDIWKPWPISYVDRTVKGGFGVMLDDVLAAGYAIAVIALAQLFIGRSM